MKKAILATILGAAMTAGCASTGKIKADVPMYPLEKEVYALGFRVSTDPSLPEEASEFNNKTKLLYAGSAVGGANYITDLITVNCPEKKSVVPVETGSTTRLYMSDEQLAFLKQVDNFMRNNSHMLEGMVKEKFDFVQDTGLFDYSKPRTITLYMHKGKYAEESKIEFKPEEIAAEIRWFSEGDNAMVRYMLTGSDKMQFKAKKAALEQKKKESKEPDAPEIIKAAQHFFDMMGSSYFAIPTQFRDDGVCKLE